MSTGGQLVFLLCATAAIVCAVLVISLRNPLRSAMALLGNIVSIAALYLTLHAHLLAAIQLLVYAGAVVVLFVFVIMLIGPSSMPKSSSQKGLMLRMAAGAVLAIVTGAIAFEVAGVTRDYVDLDFCASGAADCEELFGGVDALSDALYGDAAVPFELLSVLLLVAIIAAIAVARGHQAHEKRALEDRKKEAGAQPSSSG